MDTKGEIDRNTVIIENLSTSPTPMDRSSRYKIDKETWALNDTLDQMDTALQNLGDTGKAILRRKFIVRQSYFRKQENSLVLKLKQLEKGKRNSKLVEIIKIEAEISGDSENNRKDQWN